MDEITPDEVRDIQFTKGAAFSTKFIHDFKREWAQVTQAVRKSGKDLSIPIVKG